MEKLQFDSGIREYDLGTGGILRFNPGDPNLYARFLEATVKVQDIEKELIAQAKNVQEADGGQGVVGLLQDADKKMKELLRWVFGQENDFDRILGGINLLAVGANGKRVAANLFAVLQPILLEGAEACAREQAEKAVTRAKQRRNQA